MWVRIASRSLIVALGAALAVQPTAALAIPAAGDSVTVPHNFQPGYDTYAEFHTGVAT